MLEMRDRLAADQAAGGWVAATHVVIQITSQ